MNIFPGNTGDQGPQGNVGLQGNIGARGPTGEVGVNGTEGDVGIIGDVGDEGIEGELLNFNNQMRSFMYLFQVKRDLLVQKAEKDKKEYVDP